MIHVGRRSTDAIEHFQRQHTDLFLNNHPKRVAYTSLAIGAALKYTTEHQKGLAVCGITHDAGKIHPEARHYFTTGYLKYPESLRTEITVLHQRLGPVVIDQVPMGKYEPWRKIAKIVASNHHKNFVSHKNQLPQENWIVAVADIWDAITSNHPEDESERGYREPMGLPQAVRVLADLALWGKTDPVITEVFITKCLGLSMPKLLAANKDLKSDS
jgi:HD-GYP domain-containing protein (c-di-GMP phosphodiesterase class II)